MREIENVSYTQWQHDYRRRLLKSIEKTEEEQDIHKWFECARYVQTCPDCFCPNLQSFNAYPYSNEKGFVCPNCGNRFTMPSVKHAKENLK